jgi:hypothetical protein
MKLARLVPGLLTGICFAVGLVGCQPRGESHTIDQIFSDARSSYHAASQQGVASDVSASLKGLSEALDRLAGIGGAGDGRDVAAQVADTLTALVEKAGIPSRPAMTALINQYRNVASASGSAPSLGAANLKLLAARTYSLVGSELGGVKFGL